MKRADCVVCQAVREYTGCVEAVLTFTASTAAAASTADCTSAVGCTASGAGIASGAGTASVDVAASLAFWLHFS